MTLSLPTELRRERTRHTNQGINFSSNDYLGLSQHPDVKKSFKQGVDQYGFGSGASVFLSGYKSAHQALEEAMADFLQRDRALFFNSGYHANLGVIATLANRESHVIADKDCHASLLDGIQLSRAKLERFKHQDTTHAAQLLKSQSTPSLLVTESVFSMTGKITSLPTLSTLAERYSASTLLDDAHGFGILGDQGRGACEHFNLNQEEVPYLITPLGKALGACGAIVSGSTDFVEAMIQFSRTYRYTTALPPAIAAAALTALEVLKKSTARREKLKHLIQTFNQQAQEHDLPLYSMDETPIRAIHIGDNQKALTLQNRLREQGFFVTCIRPPTVPKETARLRISLSCLHSTIQIKQLLRAIHA